MKMQDFANESLQNPVLLLRKKQKTTENEIVKTIKKVKCS